MKYPNYKWVDVAYGGAAKRNNVIEVQKLKKPKGTPDCYRTVYRYPEEFKTHFDAHGTVSGYKGPVYADFVPIDIDNKDLSVALETARKAIEEIAAKFDVVPEELWYFFSGLKGFHICIPADLIKFRPGRELPDYFKHFVKALLPDCHIDFSIYDRVRLFRISNTKHSRSGLYKVPLEAREILHKSVEEIKELAREPRDLPLEREHEYNEALSKLFFSYKPSKEKGISTKSGSGKIPKRAKRCYYAILEGVKEGNRDNTALRLAVHFRKQAYDADLVLALMRQWNKKNNPPLEKKDIEKAVKQAFEKPYDFGCNDEVLREYCDPSCHIHGKKTGADRKERIYDLTGAYEKYVEYIKNISKRQITVGIPRLDKPMRGIAPGETCTVMARTGVGKTALMLNIISHVVVTRKVPTLVFSMEQPVAQIFERMVQISNKQSGRQVEEQWKKESDCRDRWFSNTVKSFGCAYIVDDDFLTIEDIYGYYEDSEEVIGEKPSLICIDYLGRMKSTHYSVYESVSELAKQIKNLAKELDVAVIFLHQTSRAGGDGSQEITLEMGRDSGVTEEVADFIIGLWRPEKNEVEAQAKEAEPMRVGLLKNRKGPLMNDELLFHKRTLIIDTEEGLMRRGIWYQERGATA